MKKNLLSAVIACMFALASNAQCAAGSTTSSLNWDALKYLSTGTYVTAAMAATQNFAFGKNSIRIQYSGVTSTGENALHSDATGSYGAGNDVQFSGNGTITLTFATAVSNVKFSIYDNDKGQTTTVSALNGAVGIPVTLSKAVATTADLTIVSSTVTGVGSNRAENANTTTVNVDVAGPVTSITLNVSTTNTGTGSADSEYWLSDISACQSTTFPTGYYAVSRPWGTMPGYVLAAINSSIYMVDPATGTAKFIFTDGATSGTLNSLAYDPYNKIIYYTFSLTNNGSASASEKRVRKYDMNTQTSTTILNDITSLGIPTFTQGVESGAGAFYDGAYYIGIEGGADNGAGGPKSTSNNKSIIWRLDFTSGVPTSATQVYAVSGDTHDWSDFSINDGTLYDFNGDATTPDYYHLNMQTGVNTLVPVGNTAPKQSAVGWNGNIYWLSSQIGQYNLAGSVGTKYTISSTPALSNWSTSSAPSFGDGGEAYRPKADFGDAAATYDPDATAPAVHEITSTLTLGATIDIEWDKTASTNADADGGDEDGSPFVSILNQNSGNYLTQVDVYNNTGAPATLCAWVDFNNNGVFETGEGISKTVPTGTSMQRIDMFWTGISTSLAAFSNVFMRIRVTSASNGMTTANPTGYFANGEVEDYKVLVNQATLPLKVTSFSAAKMGDDKVQVAWSSIEEEPNVQYTVERSADSRNWSAISFKTITVANAFAEHKFLDQSPTAPLAYYRLKVKDEGGEIRYTVIKQVTFPTTSPMQVSPNPARDHMQVELSANSESGAEIWLYGLDGKLAQYKELRINKGYNKFPLALSQSLVSGLYTLKIVMNDEVLFKKIVVSK